MTNKTDKTTSKSFLASKGMNWILVIVFVIAVIITAVLTYIVVRDLVTSWQITNLPGIVIKTPAPGEASQLTPGGPTLDGTQAAVIPGEVPGAPTPEPWNGATRVNFLVMGLDYRDWSSGQGPPRTDTMILLTVDPISKSAGMLSIPRDLWVNIPGFKYGKINTAYQLGEAYKLPGGGPGLAMKTVEGLLGIPIQYYGQIDFSAFVKFVDLIGGVRVNIAEPIKIDIIGADNKDIPVKKLQPGWQRLPGIWALGYARARNTPGGDFDRAKRQQEVILSIRDRILKYDMLPMLFAKAPDIYNTISAGIHTNMNIDEAIRLAWMVKDIPVESIRSGIISKDQVTFGQSPDGLDVLKPRPEQIRQLRDEIFTASGAINPSAGKSKEELMKAENAKLSVQNGSQTPGLAARTQAYLVSLGINVVDVSNADNAYTSTSMTDFTGNPHTLTYLMELMNISPNKIYNRYDPASPYDVQIVLGADWANNNKIP
jgi:LCP family protein required for cell wall assembly